MVGGLCARPCKARCSGKGAELVQDPGRAVVGAPPRGPGRRAAERGYRGLSGDDRPLAGEDADGRRPPAFAPSGQSGWTSSDITNHGKAAPTEAEPLTPAATAP